MLCKLIFFSLAAFLWLSFPQDTHAKRLLPQVVTTKAAAKLPPAVRTSKGVEAKVSFRGDRRAIIIQFTNLQIASSVSYQLVYTSGGRQEGAGGSVRRDEVEPAVRELLFGTCSRGVCRYHTGISSARLTITTTLPNGTRIVRAYKLRV